MSEFNIEIFNFVKPNEAQDMEVKSQTGSKPKRIYVITN
jgi:hypothetical protein